MTLLIFKYGSIKTKFDNRITQTNLTPDRKMHLKLIKMMLLNLDFGLT